jgi:hypothetical protein
LAGDRNSTLTSLEEVGISGHYWSSSVIANRAFYLYIFNSNSFMDINWRANGGSVRCIKN